MQNRKQGQTCVFSSKSITFCRFSYKNLFHSRYIDPISCFHIREYCWKRLNFLLLLKVKATQKLTMCTALAGKVSESFAQGAWSSFKFCVLAKWKKSAHIFFDMYVNFIWLQRGEHWKLNHLYLYPGSCCPQPAVKKKRNKSEGILNDIPCVISVTDTVYIYVGCKQFNTGWTTQSFRVHNYGFC